MSKAKRGIALNGLLTTCVTRGREDLCACGHNRICHSQSDIDYCGRPGCRCKAFSPAAADDPILAALSEMCRCSHCRSSHGKASEWGGTACWLCGCNAFEHVVYDILTDAMVPAPPAYTSLGRQTPESFAQFEAQTGIALSVTLDDEDVSGLHWAVADDVAGEITGTDGFGFPWRRRGKVRFIPRTQWRMG